MSAQTRFFSAGDIKRRLRRTPLDSDRVRMAAVCGSRGHDELRGRLRRCLSTSGCSCRQDIEWRETCGLTHLQPTKFKFAMTGLRHPAMSALWSPDREHPGQRAPLLQEQVGQTGAPALLVHAGGAGGVFHVGRRSRRQPCRRLCSAKTNRPSASSARRHSRPNIERSCWCEGLCSAAARHSVALVPNL